MAYKLSIAPTAEKAQHEPHEPWFLTGATTFLVLQSIASANSISPNSYWFSV